MASRKKVQKAIPSKADTHKPTTTSNSGKRSLSDFIAFQSDLNPKPTKSAKTSPTTSRNKPDVGVRMRSMGSFDIVSIEEHHVEEDRWKTQSGAAVIEVLRNDATGETKIIYIPDSHPNDTLIVDHFWCVDTNSTKSNVSQYRLVQMELDSPECVMWISSDGETRNWISCIFVNEEDAFKFHDVCQGIEKMSFPWYHETELESYIVPETSAVQPENEIKYDQLQLIELSDNSNESEYQFILTHFLSSITRNHSSPREQRMYKNRLVPSLEEDTICIYKIRQQARKDGYAAKREQLLKILGNDVSKLNEIALYHGTNLEKLPKILHQGFLRQFVSRAKYGQGVYFARDALYSIHPQFAKPDDDLFQHILLCNVICGEWVKGSIEMKVPPPKPHNEFLPHETTVNDVENPSIFVTYQDDQALPTHLISLRQN